MFLPTSHKQLFLPTQNLTTYAHGNFQLTTHTSVEGKMCSWKYTHVYIHMYTDGWSQLDSPPWLFSSGKGAGQSQSQVRWARLSKIRRSLRSHQLMSQSSLLLIRYSAVYFSMARPLCQQPPPTSQWSAQFSQLEWGRLLSLSLQSKCAGFKGCEAALQSVDL